ncbi:hypothetical protein JCM5350_002149 [Sporobolomyces pararoseus]
MAKAHSVFFYGVFVKSALLCFASDAFETSRGALLAVDMIKARRQADKLELTRPFIALSRLSEEIWLLVKEQLVDQAAFEAADTLIGNWDPFLYEGDIKAPDLWDGAVFRQLGEFWESYGETDGTRGLFPIKSLLASFGLALPVESPCLFPEMKGSDLDALTPVALPLLSSQPTKSFPRSNASRPSSLYFGDPTHSLVNFSTSSFNLPSDANLRIIRFLSLFNLKAEDPPAPLFYTPFVPEPPATSTEEENREEGSPEVKGSSSVKVEPQWHLLTSCE